MNAERRNMSRAWSAPNEADRMPVFMLPDGIDCDPVIWSEYRRQAAAQVEQ